MFSLPKTFNVLNITVWKHCTGNFYGEFTEEISRTEFPHSEYISVALTEEGLIHLGNVLYQATIKLFLKSSMKFVLSIILSNHG